MDFKLSERQGATVATAITVLSTFVILCAVGALLWLLGVFVGRFSQVFLPLAVAGVVALILKPYYDWFTERLRLNPVLALGAVFLVILIPLVGVVWFFGDLVVTQVADLVEQAPGWGKKALATIQERWPNLSETWESYGMREKVENIAEGKETMLLSALRSLGLSALSASAGVFGALGSLFSWAVLPVYVAFFLLIDPETKKGLAWSEVAFPFLKPETREDLTYLVNEFVSIVVAFFRGQLLIAFLQGVLFAVGFELIGLRYGFILGLVLGFLNIIPYLGSIVGLGVALPLALFQSEGGWSLLAAVLVVFTVVQTIEGYLLTPRIMGQTTGLHPMIIIVAIFFWGSALNGIAGMILAIPLTAFFVVFWRLAREKYIRELV